MRVRLLVRYLVNFIACLMFHLHFCPCSFVKLFCAHLYWRVKFGRTAKFLISKLMLWLNCPLLDWWVWVSASATLVMWSDFEMDVAGVGLLLGWVMKLGFCSWAVEYDLNIRFPYSESIIGPNKVYLPKSASNHLKPLLKQFSCRMIYMIRFFDHVPMIKREKL